MSTDREDPRSVVFSNTLSPLPIYLLIYYSPYSRKSSTYISPSVRATKYHYLLINLLIYLLHGVQPFLRS